MTMRSRGGEGGRLVLLWPICEQLEVFGGLHPHLVFLGLLATTTLILRQAWGGMGLVYPLPATAVGFWGEPCPLPSRLPLLKGQRGTLNVRRALGDSRHGEKKHTIATRASGAPSTTHTHAPRHFI